MTATPISSIRRGLPGTGILGRVDGGKGPVQLLSTQELFKLGLQPAAYPAVKAKTSGKWTNPISITWTAAGDVTGSVSFDGSANVSCALTLQNTGVVAGSYSYASITVDAKGRITAASSGTTPAIWAPLMNGDTGAPLVVVDGNGNAIMGQIA